MRARWQLDRLAAEVTALGRRGLPPDAFFAEVGARLRRVVDNDALSGTRWTPRPC